MSSGVEVDEIAGPDVHRPHAKSHLSRVYAIEIDQSFQRALQACGIVEARRFDGARRI